MELNMLNTTAPIMQTQLEYTHRPTQLVQPPETAPLWYAVRVRSKFERNVSIVLEHKGLEQFLPTYRSRRAWTDRTKTLDLPLFPGYVFCRIPLEQRNRVVTTDGVVGLVGAGRLPIPVSEVEIEAIRTMIQSQVETQPWPFLKIGQTVRICHGSLSGIEGILVRVKNSWRLVVSLTLLERSVAVEIDATYVSPVH
jgi:transcription termination/antitermination protein NusG